MSPSGQGIGLYRAQGIVLRTIRLGEADRIVTLLTQNHGRLKGVAKGARRSKSRFGARLDAFTHVDLQLYRGRSDLEIITQADILTTPKRIREDYGSFCAASAMADVIERTTPERERNVRAFLLLRSALKAVEDGARDASLLAYAFLAKLTSMSGLHPTLRRCVDCGSGARVAFSHARGGAVCGPCSDKADPKVGTEALESWTVLLDTEWDDLRDRSLPPGVLGELTGLMLAFVRWHTETQLRAFSVLSSATR